MTSFPARLRELPGNDGGVFFSFPADVKGHSGVTVARRLQAMRTVALRLLEVPRWLQATHRHQ